MSTSRDDRCYLSPFGFAWSGTVGSLLPVRLPVVALATLLGWLRLHVSCLPRAAFVWCFMVGAPLRAQDPLPPPCVLFCVASWLKFSFLLSMPSLQPSVGWGRWVQVVAEPPPFPYVVVSVLRSGAWLSFWCAARNSKCNFAGWVCLYFDLTRGRGYG